MAYLLGLFAVKLYDAKKDQKWSWFLSTINQGRRAAIQAKFITDAVFILIDFFVNGRKNRQYKNRICNYTRKRNNNKCVCWNNYKSGNKKIDYCKDEAE